MQYSSTALEQLRRTWLRGGPFDSDPRPALVVFPHAAGGASFYRSWLASPHFSVRIVQYPGREDRIAEPRPASLNTVADRIAEVLITDDHRPLCLFGHSMGALVAFEAARRLESAGGDRQLLLCVSSYTAPHLEHHHPLAEPEGSQASDDEAIIAYARSVSGETGTLDNSSLREVIIAALRADFQLVGQYRTDPEPRVDAPILALRGADEDIEPADMDAWSQVTRADCRSLIFPGGHFYLADKRNAVLEAVHRWREELDHGPCPPTEDAADRPPADDDHGVQDDDVAVIGCALRAPGASNLDEFWANLCAGIESLTHFSDDELRSAGTTRTQLDDPRLVRARPILADVANFDAEFFGYAPSEARLIDPQQRLFLECAWEAVESAGYDLQRYGGAVGVFAGNAGSTYYLANLATNPDYLEAVGPLQTALATENDFLAPRVSYKLNLRGPSISLATGCSTSLVATHLAVQSVLSGESDMALAGGSTIGFPQHAGHVAQAGGAISTTGRCRAFDAAADGTLTGDGVGAILVKRAKAAIEDGDPILGIIKGTAVNNDGANKAGFAAPSITGQADVITEALAVAAVPAETVDYVETHGTGTPIGDPIEIAALTDAFRSMGDTRTAACRLGTLKPNIGHTGPSSGVLAIIKVLLMFRHRMYPPAINFTVPNPQIDFPKTPFYMGTDLRRWETHDGQPRRAGVGSYSMGGTNAHIVVQEPPVSRPSEPASDGPHLLTLSARTASALAAARTNLAHHLAQHPEQDLSSIAATLRLGRRAFGRRFATVCRDSAHAQAVLAGTGAAPQRTGIAADKPPSVAFLFPGQGSQFAGMGARLYATSPVYRRHVDDCACRFEPLVGMDLRTLLRAPDDADADTALRNTGLTQPALFTVGYALARLLDDWGVAPIAMLGHSIGELVAACISGVFTFDEAIELVALRGRLIQQCGIGAMAAVGAPVSTVVAMLPEGVSIAAINAPEQTVVTGTEQGVETLAGLARKANIRYTRLAVDRAFHSALVDSAAERFTTAVARTRPQPARIPFISNVSGTWITMAQACDPSYWGSQLRETVRFASGLARLRADHPEAMLVEVGPGHILRGLVAVNTPGTEVVSMLGGRSGDGAAAAAPAAAALWVAGVEPAWERFAEPRRRVPLPTYPFQRQRFWVGPRASVSAAVNASDTAVSEAGGPAPRTDGAATTPATVVAQIWCEALGVTRVDPHHNFFDLGGNSLIAANIVVALEQRCRVDISVAQLWDQGPTLADLTDLVMRRSTPPPAMQEETADERGQ